MFFYVSFSLITRMYSGKLMFRNAPCGCVWQCLLYCLFGGYNKETFSKFSVCSSCLEEEKTLTAKELYIKEQLDIENFWSMWIEETREPGTTDDEWYFANNIYLYK